MFQETDIPKFKWNLGLVLGKRPHKSLTTKKVMNELEKQTYIYSELNHSFSYV